VGAAKPEMKVSVVIPAFNERDTIEHRARRAQLRDRALLLQFLIKDI
jgi:hypothetical protein